MELIRSYFFNLKISRVHNIIILITTYKQKAATFCIFQRIVDFLNVCQNFRNISLLFQTLVHIQWWFLTFLKLKNIYTYTHILSLYTYIYFYIYILLFLYIMHTL